MLLTYYFPDVPVLTSFVTGKGSSKRAIDIRIANETLGANKSAALLGFQAFTDVIKLANFVESLS